MISTARSRLPTGRDLPLPPPDRTVREFTRGSPIPGRRRRKLAAKCRLLSFFKTQYYDDVVIERPTYTSPSIQLVATTDNQVIGLIDIEASDEAATIEVVAVHPMHSRRGVATSLLDRALPQLDAWDVRTLDAWTREDEPANRWYRSQHFTEQYRYLHVHKEWDDDDTGFTAPKGLFAPIRAFSHAELDRKADLRGRFRRVYECRQYVRDLAHH